MAVGEKQSAQEHLAELVKSGDLCDGYCENCEVYMYWQPGLILNCPHCGGKLLTHVAQA